MLLCYMLSIQIHHFKSVCELTYLVVVVAIKVPLILSAAVDGRLRCPTAAATAPHAQRVLGKRQPDAALDAVLETLAVQLVERLGCIHDVLKLHKTHGPVHLGTETQPLVALLLGKQLHELLLGRVHWQVAHVQSVARGVLVGRVGRGKHSAAVLQHLDGG